MWVKQCHKLAMTGNGNHTTICLVVSFDLMSELNMGTRNSDCGSPPFSKNLLVGVMLVFEYTMFDSPTNTYNFVAHRRLKAIVAFQTVLPEINPTMFLRLYLTCLVAMPLISRWSSQLCCFLVVYYPQIHHLRECSENVHMFKSTQE